MAKLFVLVVLVALVSTAEASFFINTVDGGCGFTAGGTFIDFTHDKDRKFVSSVHASDIIESMGNITANFDLTSSVKPCERSSTAKTHSRRQ